MSYSLLFGQSEDGRKVLRNLVEIPIQRGPPFKAVNNGPGHDNDKPPVLRIYDWNHSTLRQDFEASKSPPSIEDFVLFGGRLEALHRQMRDWRPRRVKNLRRPGYGDRFTYYTQCFALGIAVIGLIGLVSSILQTAYAIKAYNDSLAVALQSLEISVKSLNVSLEALALQKRSMNITT
jgi:hypothetical protein